jgi:hypothetical protein
LDCWNRREEAGRKCGFWVFNRENIELIAQALSYDAPPAYKQGIEMSPEKEE